MENYVVTLSQIVTVIAGIVTIVIIVGLLLGKKIKEVLFKIKWNKDVNDHNHENINRNICETKTRIDGTKEDIEILMIALEASKIGAIKIAKDGDICRLKGWHNINRLSPPYISEDEIQEIGNAFCPETIKELIKQRSIDSIQFLCYHLKMNPNRIIDEKTEDTMAHFAMKARVSKEMISNLDKLNVNFETKKNKEKVVAIDIFKDDPEVEMTNNAKEAIAANKPAETNQ